MAQDNRQADIEKKKEHRRRFLQSVEDFLMDGEIETENHLLNEEIEKEIEKLHEKKARKLEEFKARMSASIRSRMRHFSKEEWDDVMARMREASMKGLRDSCLAKRAFLEARLKDATPEKAEKLRTRMDELDATIDRLSKPDPIKETRDGRN
jgi:hypothetical protein